MIKIWNATIIEQDITIIIIIICGFCNERHINPLGSQGVAV